MSKEYTYRFRIYPAKEQIAYFNEEIGYNRFVYNFFLEYIASLYKNYNIPYNYFEFKRKLKLLKKGFPFLKQANSQSLQATFKNLDTAFKNFFRHKAGYPNFKKKNGSNSIEIPQNFAIDNNLLYIPKLKSGIKVKFHRRFYETVKSIKITRTPSNKYYASMLVEKFDYMPYIPKKAFNKVSGIDLGIKDFAVVTTGTNETDYTTYKIPNPAYLVKSERKLKKLNRQFAKKKKGSKNKIKFKSRLSKLYEKVSNQRIDYIHRTSLRAVIDSQVIVLEDLNIKGMVKNRHLSKSISDVSWGIFTDQLKYKAGWYGRNIFKVNRFYPSSKTCNACGYIKADLQLKDREWTCPVCHTTHDRDINASINLFLEGLKVRRVSPEPALMPTPAEYATAGIQNIGYSCHT
jgi:putative transposase